MASGSDLLLISPQSDERRRMCRWLDEAGHTVRLGHEVDQVPALVAEVRPDLIICDLFTHPSLALEGLLRIRDDHPNWDTPILALTSADQPCAAEAALEAGADDWLVWPTRRRALTARVNLLLKMRCQQERIDARTVENSALLRQRDQVVTMLTHDLKSPLTVILGHLRLLLGGKAGDLTSDEAQRGLRATLRSAKHLMDYVEDFLALSGSMAGTVPMRREPVNLGALLAELVDVHRAAAQEEEIRLTLSLPPDLGEVVGDEDMLARAVGNLLGNALKYTQEGGVIELGARGVEEAVRVWVRDSGPGIAPDELSQIFDPFHRARGAGRRARGSGLGLSVVRSITQAHSGEVEVESEPGVGSRFTLYLPRRPGVTRRRRALIVEDNLDFARIMALSLRLEGVESVICESAEEALELLEREPPDLITLDLMLPGMQGWEFLDQVRERMGHLDTPVLVLTANKRRLKALRDAPLVRIRMDKDAFDQGTFRQAARELLRQ